MPVPTRANEKNIWIAAGDGDLDRVKVLIEEQGLSPNIPDENTYTPMHAAASYGHLPILTYLISKGGNVNITDSDGDTPLYSVESPEVAQFLIDNGAIIDWKNIEGISPADHLQDEFPEISTFLTTHLSTVEHNAPDAPQQAPQSQHFTDQQSERLTDSLMSSVQQVMQRAEQDGSDPSDELRRVVQRAVIEGVIEGHSWTAEGGGEASTEEAGGGVKRARLDDPER